MIRSFESKKLSPIPLQMFSAFSALASYKEVKGIKEDKHSCLRGALASYPPRPCGSAAQQGLYCPRDSQPAPKLNKSAYLVEAEGNPPPRKKRVPYLSGQIATRRPAGVCIMGVPYDR